MGKLILLNPNKISFKNIISFLFILFASKTLASEAPEKELVKSLQGLSLEAPDTSQLQSVGGALQDGKEEYDSDSEDEENYIYKPISLEDRKEFFTGKTFLPFFRGLHITKNQFSNREARRKFKRTSQAGKNIYASAVYENAPEKDDPLDLDEKPLTLAKDIQDLMKQMEGLCGIIRNKKLYRNFRDYIQELYTNDYDKFHSFLMQKDPIFSNAQKTKITKNPFVSSSDLAAHAYKYAYGLKYLGKEAIKIMPEYDVNGRPKHPYLGKIISILIPWDKVKELNPTFVLNLYAENNIWVSTHFSNNILAEREITFPGYVPGQYVLLDIPVRVPSFYKEWKNWHFDKYGLSKKKFDEFKGKILETKGQIFQQEKAVKGLIEFIYPKLTQKLQDTILTFLKYNQSQLRWKGLYNNLRESPLLLEDVKEERESLILEYVAPYKVTPYKYGRPIRIEYLDFQELKILTENLQPNKTFEVLIDEREDDRALSFFLSHPLAKQISKLTLHNFNVMDEIYGNLNAVRNFIKINKKLESLSLIGTEAEYEEDSERLHHNNKYGLSPGNIFYEEDPNIQYFSSFIREIVNGSSIKTLDLSENNLPKNALNILEETVKSSRKIDVKYDLYDEDYE